jgi:hypothetical protein
MALIDQHLRLCKPVRPGNSILQSVGIDPKSWPDLMEYQGLIAAPMFDFHTGNITAVACTDGVNRVSYAGSARARQCGFYVGSAIRLNSEFAELTGSEKPLIFCTDLITSILVNLITRLPVMFSTDVTAFKFSGATECYIRQPTSRSIENALNACGDVDLWFPVGSIESSRHVKWMDAVQAAAMIEVNYDHA